MTIVSMYHRRLKTSSSRSLNRTAGLFFVSMFFATTIPVFAQLNQHAPVWSGYSSGHFYHRDFSVSGYSTTTDPYALPLQDPSNVTYTFPTYSQPSALAKTDPPVLFKNDPAVLM